jgi:uncharacterized protein
MSRITYALFAALLAITSLVASPAVARDTKVDNPAIWKIDGPKGDVFLFGSVHLLPKGVNWRTPALEAALKSANVVVFEIDLDKAKDPVASRDLVMKLGMLPPDTTLRKLLSPERRAKFERVAKSVGLPPMMLDSMRPWLAAVTIGVQWIVSKGYDPNSGVDQHIWTWAKENNKERAALETMEEQLNVFAGLTLEQEIEYLVISVDQIDDSPDMLDKMITAWRTADLKTLDKVLNEGMEAFPVLNQRLLGDRHAKWLPQIERMLADGRTFAVVVGTAHLIGKGSVIDMLRKKGITVQGP